MKNPWPYSIAAFFAIAITGVAAFISFAVRQDMDLVRPDYYEHEILFQKQIERVARTRALGASVDLKYEPAREIIELRLPSSHASAAARLRLYRPSNASLDRVNDFDVAFDGSHTIEANDLASGIWRAQLSWIANGNEYYLEREFIVP